MTIHLDSPALKITHKNENKKKTLEEHIGEIKKISQKILKKHLMDGENNLGIINELAENHDLGKLNPEWNVDNDKRPPHSALSTYLYIKDRGENIDFRIPFLILKHHGLLKSPQYTGGWVRENIVKHIKHKDIILKREDILFFQKFIKKLVDYTKNDNNYSSNLLYSDLFGVFKTADILSAKFETDMDILDYQFTYTPDYLKEIIKEYVKSKGLEFDENRWKQWVEMAKDRKHILLLAPTGWGKTFAAITVALSQNPPPSHIIYVLPTITAIRKMKKSLESFFDGLEIEENYYFADLEKIKELNKESETEPPTEVFILKTFLAPITITTLDQVLLSLLNVGKYHLKRYHFRNSFFIFDEYHLFPPNGLLLLLRFIREYNEYFGYNMKTLFMSATEDVGYTKEIEKFFKIKKYVYLYEYKTRRRYNYKLVEKDILSPQVIDMLSKYSSNNKVLVILNTVEKAIKLYLKMSKSKKSKDVILLHSRFTYKDRRDKEDLLEKKIKSNVLFISTQVAEVSLDLSFDYLFTEAAPLSSLIQRFGRVNRYGTYTSEVNVFVTHPDELIRENIHYPYNIEDIKNVWETLQSIEKIQNELDLLKQLNKRMFSSDIANKRNTIKKYFDLWKSSTHWFYSLDIEDEELNKILKYRDTFTSLVIPECMQKEVLNILSSESKVKKILIKDYFVPVPIWWLLGNNKKFVSSLNSLIFLGGNRFVYSKVLGYFDSEKISLENLQDDITICRGNALIY